MAMSFLRVLGAPLLLAAILVACGGALSSGPAGSGCQAAGGSCIVTACENQAPSSAQDCSPNGGFGGFFCCLEPADGGGQNAGPSCAERTSGAEDAAFAGVAQVKEDLGCKTDSDCVIANDSNTCWNGCGFVLNQIGAAQLQSVVSQIDATICATFAADGCTAPPSPPCVPLVPFCENGACAGT